MTTTRGGALKLLTAGLGLVLIASACAPDESGGSGSGQDGELSGKVVASGSSTVEPITSLVAEGFAAENPDVNISVDGPGTSDGFELFCKGNTDISDASRAIAPEEIEACEEAGIEFIEIKVAIDGLSVITSPDNDAVECLDFYDLYALLGPEAEGFRKWSDADGLGEEIGAAHTPYPDTRLEVTAPGEESGTYDSFGELVLEDIAYEERGIDEDDPVIRKDYQSSADDNVIIQGIRGSSGSLGWVGYAFYVNNQDSVKALSIAEKGDDCVEPTEETIADGSYPIARDLFIYVDATKAEEKPELEAFVDYYLSEEGLASVSDAGYVDLPQEEIEASVEAWEAGETGTREKS